MRVRVGCKIVYESTHPTPMMLVVQPQQEYPNHYRLIDERRNINEGVPVHDYVDGFGNIIWRLVAPVGTLTIEYDAIAEVTPTPDPILPTLLRTPVPEIPDDLIVYTLPSRHCPSDLFINDAWKLFGHLPGGWGQVQAICDWLHSNVTYSGGSSNASTTGWDAYQQRSGVCRDFAHLGVSFCRALNYPARYVCGYLPDINVPFDPAPMDFHAWFEVYIEGAWHTFDARHNRPRTGRVLIATGRDAVDVALSTVYGGSQLTEIRVWADQVDDQQRLNSVSLESSDSHG